MALNDLTTLAAVKAYLTILDTSADAILPSFITRVSAACLGDMGRDTLLARAYTDMLDGTGTRAMMVSRWPVLSIASVQIGNLIVPPNPSPPYGAGWVADQWDGIPPGEPCRIIVSGWCFARGQANVSLSYTAGYGISGEPQVVPDDPGPYVVIPAQPWGKISVDNGVTYANGTKFVAVASAPGLGQYIPPNPFAVTSPSSNYTFSVEDANADVLLNYSFIPDAIEGAVCQWVAEQWEYKKRIGLRNKTLGGQETMGYIVKDIPDYVKFALTPYAQKIPLQ